MLVYLKSFLVGAVAVFVPVLLISARFPFLGGIVVRPSLPAVMGFCAAGVLLFAVGFAWEYRRASRHIASR